MAIDPDYGEKVCKRAYCKNPIEIIFFKRLLKNGEKSLKNEVVIIYL